MRRAPARRPASGFTLIEIILVVLIFGIMSAMAYGGLNSVLKSRVSIEAAVDRTAEYQKAFMRMRSDFQNLAIRPIRDNFGDVQPSLRGSSREPTVEFTRGGWRNPLYLHRSSFERVGYVLTEHRLERLSYRVLDRAQDTQPVRVTLLDKVDELRLRYMDKQQEWGSDWPSKSQGTVATGDTPPPLAIEITLKTKDMGELRFVFKPGAEPPPTGALAATPGGLDSTNTGTTTTNKTPEPDSDNTVPPDNL